MWLAIHKICADDECVRCGEIIARSLKVTVVIKRGGAKIFPYKGRYLYNVRKFFVFFDLLPPCHIQNPRNLVPFVCFFGTPLPPPTSDII